MAVFTPEDLALTPEQQAAYDAAFAALRQQPSTFLAPIPKLVSIEDTSNLTTSTTTSSTTNDINTNRNANDNNNNDIYRTLVAAAVARHNNNTTTTTATNQEESELSDHAAAEEVVTLITPRRGHHHLLRALEELEGLEKEEQSVLTRTDLTRVLTEIIMNHPTTTTSSTEQQQQPSSSLVVSSSIVDSRSAVESLERLGRYVPRRVCQHPFRRNDIVWVCRTCQADETCVLCHACYSQSNHEGHDVAFYHAQAGGCCDCGDPDAWDPAGFCPRHGPNAIVSSDTDTDQAVLPPSLLFRVRGVVPAVVDWMVQFVAANAETAYARANPSKKKLRKMKSQVERAATTTSGTQPFVPHRLLTFDHMDLEETKGDDDDDDDDDGADHDDHDQDDDDEGRNPSDFFAVSRYPHAFSPLAASSSMSERSAAAMRYGSIAKAAAEQLANVGRQGHGLFIVLHADDVHTAEQLREALREFFGTANNYFPDPVLDKVVIGLRQYGQLVVFGTMELVAECGATQVHLWMDGDKIASVRIGGVVLERAARLTERGFFCSILTREELIIEQRAVAALQWLSVVARSCDPLCQSVAECILPNRHLVPLLRADFKMSARVTKAWYSLLLTLLAVPTFKSHLAAAYCDTYRTVTAKYARGMGVFERSGYTLSVQFLNRVTYVVNLVQGRDLLGKLGRSLLETLQVASRSQYLNGRLNPNHFVLTHRRYSPCISDLKCVLNVKGMARVIACRGGTFLLDWVSALSLAQFMDPQTWRHWDHGHIEEESRGWVGAFNASISLGSLFERLLGWADDEKSPIEDPSSPLSKDLISCSELTFHILTNGLQQWQRTEMLSYVASEYSAVLDTHRRCPASLPFSTIAAAHGTALAMQQLPISQSSPFSFHLPLHRFVSGCLRELCLRKSDSNCDIAALLQRLHSQLPAKQRDELFLGLMEFPTLVLTRAAQVRANLWRRNGSGLNDQVLNYAEPPFCRNMRDADLLMVQFAAIARTGHLSMTTRPSSDVGVAFLLNLVIHRLGIFDFVGLAEAPDGNVSRYLEEVAVELYPAEKRHVDLESDLVLPWIYSPARDSTSAILLLEEFLHFIIIFISELPPPVPTDIDEQMRQAKYRLYREVIHRLASGPKTHSELSEVHHVLSHWDNVLLSEEGKLINPDDATGAALGTVLAEIADRKVSTGRGKMEPDKWEMKRSAWGSYDPAFFHINLRNHQTAAECRPKPSYDSSAPFGWHSQQSSVYKNPHQPKPLEDRSSQLGWHAMPYAPMLPPAHPFFERLRRDVTSDAVVLSLAYRVLHLHCRAYLEKSLHNLSGKLPYENKEKSETALARTIHLITIGAYAWKSAREDDINWRVLGGGSLGSVFYDTDKPPTAACWIRKFLLSEPDKLLACDWYVGEEKALVLLHRLAVSGGSAGGFTAQDPTVRSGAAWLCEFALSFCPDAKDVIYPNQKQEEDLLVAESAESEAERRKKLAKQRKEEALAKMKAQAAKFACMMEVDLGSDEESERVQVSSTPTTPLRPIRHESFGSAQTDRSSSSSVVMVGASEAAGLQPYLSINEDHCDEIPPRLLQRRPRCIICNDEDVTETNRQTLSEGGDGDIDGQRKKSRRRTENALAFVGYAQASTVLKGGGGPPSDLASPMSTISEFVGTHVALCGHAVHSECCESYLATVSHREERHIGKRDEFRCPLCQRLSNCLVPFIDVGVDWIESPYCSRNLLESSSIDSKKSVDDMQIDNLPERSSSTKSLSDFLESTTWWISRDDSSIVWDGHSAFVEKSAITANVAPQEGAVKRKPSRRIRSIKKKDLYAAWNVMMRTPRFVRRKLRRSYNRSDSTEKEETASTSSGGEDSIGETVVWRRFMDTICDISYRADSKRLGDERFSRDDLFGEFRHYIREKYAYNLTNRFIGNEPADWPACMYNETLSDSRRQELSREKLLAKLLLTIQSFAYSCCCGAFEAKRSYRKSVEVARKDDDSSVETVLSRFGISGIVCDGKMILFPRPSHIEDSTQLGGGSWPFDGRLGKLRYFGLTVMAAAGAVADDLTQLVISFPHQAKERDPVGLTTEFPERSPIAYPVLFGNVLTHITAALCATCGRARARSDSLDVSGPISHATEGTASRVIDDMVADCEGFMKLGLLARILQVLLGNLGISPLAMDTRPILVNLQSLVKSQGSFSSSELSFLKSCVNLLEIASLSRCQSSSQSVNSPEISFDLFRESCDLAASSATTLLVNMGTIMQILVPGIVLRYENAGNSCFEDNAASNFTIFEKTMCHFNFETLDIMIQSLLTQKVIAFWFDEASCFARKSYSQDDVQASLRSLLYHSQGFRVLDWPTPSVLDIYDAGRLMSNKHSDKIIFAAEPQDDAMSTNVNIERIHSGVRQSSTADILRKEASPALLTFNSKKTVSLLGGYSPDLLHGKGNIRPRVLVLPTSYTDLYAELGTLLPDCEQTAVCLICGEVLDASGKGECTRHSYKCGAGSGVFFLLQECSGLIMHKSKAAYIQSPYVDSHGETPQFRGRPLNLDMDRYEHLREVWFSHEVRQKVVAERGSSRQIILPDFY